MVRNVLEAWLTTVTQKKGLFDSVRTPEAHTEPSLDVGEGLEDDTLDESLIGSRSLVAHHVWLDFIAELFRVDKPPKHPILSRRSLL